MKSSAVRSYYALMGGKAGLILTNKFRLLENSVARIIETGLVRLLEVGTSSICGVYTKPPNTSANGDLSDLIEWVQPNAAGTYLCEILA